MSLVLDYLNGFAYKCATANVAKSAADNKKHFEFVRISNEGIIDVRAPAGPLKQGKPEGII